MCLKSRFLVSIDNLVRRALDTDLLRLVFVIDSENAVKALELIYGGNMFAVIQAPKVSHEAVVKQYGEDFAKIFPDCDGCIGIALDYEKVEERPKDMTAKAYAAMRKEMYVSNNC